tara:strand:+ start:2568 stop:2825 length:258 start_codon:yes stop_codon:yes gene_type:complete
MDLNKFQRRARIEQSLMKSKKTDTSRAKFFEKLFFWIVIVSFSIVCFFSGLSVLYQNPILALSVIILLAIYGLLKALNFRKQKQK